MVNIVKLKRYQLIAHFLFFLLNSIHDIILLLFVFFFSEDSEEDDYTEQFPLHSPKSLSPDAVLSPTLLTLSLSVEKGAISMILPVKVKKTF